MKLTHIEKQWALSVYDHIFPSHAAEGLTLGAKDVSMDKFVDDAFEHSPFLSAVGVRLALLLIQLLPVLFIGKPKLFKQLNNPDKEKYLERWLKNRFYLIRQLALFVKMIGCFGFIGFPEVQRQMGVVKERQMPPV